MASSYRGLRPVASFRPYTSKQVGDTGPAESARRSNSRALGSSFSGARGTYVHSKLCSHNVQNMVHANYLVLFTSLCCPLDAGFRLREKAVGEL